MAANAFIGPNFAWLYVAYGRWSDKDTPVEAARRGMRTNGLGCMAAFALIDMIDAAPMWVGCTTPSAPANPTLITPGVAKNIACLFAAVLKCGLASRAFLTSRTPAGQPNTLSLAFHSRVRPCLIAALAAWVRDGEFRPTRARSAHRYW